MIRTLAEVEKDAILEAIRETKNVTRAAKCLGIGKTTIYRKLNLWGYVGEGLFDKIVPHVET